jgi:dihydroneopterin aldolase
MQAPHQHLQITLDAIIGVHAYEKVAWQPLIIEVTWQHADDGANNRAKFLITDYFARHQPQLLEHAVWRLAEILGELKPQSILIKKPNALKNAQWAGVKIDLTK